MNSTINTIHTLTVVAEQLNIWFGLSLLVAGDIGSLLNLFVFRSKAFRKQACSIYLLATSIADLFQLNFVLGTRILQNGFQLRITQASETACKLRAYTNELAPLLSFTFFTLASIDRLLSTNRRASYRSWSNCKFLALKIIPTVILFWMIILSHRLVLYRIDPISGTCQPQLGVYWWYNNYFELIFIGLIPPIPILIIGYMIVRNVRSILDRRVTPIVDRISQTQKKCSRLQQIDTQLTSVLLLQLGVSFISFVPYSSQLFYSTISQHLPKSQIYLAWENLFIDFARLCSYIFYSTKCYVFLISSSIFRTQIVRMLHREIGSN